MFSHLLNHPIHLLTVHTQEAADVEVSAAGIVLSLMLQTHDLDTLRVCIKPCEGLVITLDIALTLSQ